MDGKCSKCGLVATLAAGNISKKTGARLYRTWCASCEKARKGAWRADNRDRHNEKGRQWAAANPAKRAAVSRKYRASVPIELERERKRAWRTANLAVARAAVNARRNALRSATPRSLTELDRLVLAEIYHAAQLRGLTVDHRVPLQHPLVCGLHAPWNLQLLSSVANAKKSNSAPGIRAMRRKRV